MRVRGGIYVWWGSKPVFDPINLHIRPLSNAVSSLMYTLLKERGVWWVDEEASSQEDFFLNLCNLS